jgi:hypothetical protein
MLHPEPAADHHFVVAAFVICLALCFAQALLLAMKGK